VTAGILALEADFSGNRQGIAWPKRPAQLISVQLPFDARPPVSWPTYNCGPPWCSSDIEIISEVCLATVYRKGTDPAEVGI